MREKKTRRYLKEYIFSGLQVMGVDVVSMGKCVSESLKVWV